MSGVSPRLPEHHVQPAVCFHRDMSASPRTWSASIPSAKEVNELFDIRVILGTAVGPAGGSNPLPGKIKPAAASPAMFRWSQIFKEKTQLSARQLNAAGETPVRTVYGFIYGWPSRLVLGCDLGSTSTPPPQVSDDLLSNICQDEVILQ